MKFKPLEAEGSNAQLYSAGNVCLLILSPVMIIWWKHTLPQAQDRQFYSLSSCGKGRSQPEEALHYSWEQDEPHGQGRDVSIGQAWSCMLALWVSSFWAHLWPFALLWPVPLSLKAFSFWLQASEFSWPPLQSSSSLLPLTPCSTVCESPAVWNWFSWGPFSVLCSRVLCV